MWCDATLTINRRSFCSVGSVTITCVALGVVPSPPDASSVHLMLTLGEAWCPWGCKESDKAEQLNNSSFLMPLGKQQTFCAPISRTQLTWMWSRSELSSYSVICRIGAQLTPLSASVAVLGSPARDTGPCCFPVDSLLTMQDGLQGLHAALDPGTP